MAGDFVADQVTASAVVVIFIQYLKKSRFAPFITFETDALNKAMGALFAAFTAVGIHYSYDAASHTLMITGITLGAFVHGLWHWLTSFSFQQLIYHGVVKVPAPAPSEPEPKP